MTPCTELRFGERKLSAAAGGLALDLEPAYPWARGEARRVVLFGVPFDRVSLEEAVARIEGWIEAPGIGRSRTVMTPDTTALMRARRDPLLRRAYRQADLVTPDGVGIVWASRSLGFPLEERVSGIDLMERLFRRGAARGYRFFFLGARPGVAQAAAERLKKRYPGLRVVGAHHGYFTAREEPLLLEEIHAAGPDVLLVGLGVPKQELWMLRHREALRVPVVVGVGGSFDVWSGRAVRAPGGWQRLGLEWLWRLLHEPRRAGKAFAIPPFMALVLLRRALSALSYP